MKDSVAPNFLIFSGEVAIGGVSKSQAMWSWSNCSANMKELSKEEHFQFEVLEERP